MFIDFLDELASGVPVLAAPDIKSELGFDYFGAAWLLLVLPLALGALAEAPLLVLSDRWPRRRVVVIGLLVQAAALVAAALASSAWLFGAGLALWGTAAGVTAGVAQAALMESEADGRERAMTRWALLGSLGDAAGPAFVGGIYALGGTWRAALVVMGLGYALQAIVVRATSPAGRTGGVSAADEDEPFFPALKRGLSNRPLLVWLGATTLCTLLDEILVAFGSLRLRDDLGASPALRAYAFTAFALCSTLGLVITDRLLARLSGRAVLMGSAALCLAAYAAWLAATSPVALVLLLGAVGLGTGPLYPLTQARAYGAHADRPGVVAAIERLYSPIELLAPMIVGLAADHLGLVPALSLLALQPLVILLVARRAPS